MESVSMLMNTVGISLYQAPAQTVIGCTSSTNTKNARLRMNIVKLTVVADASSANNFHIFIGAFATLMPKAAGNRKISKLAKCVRMDIHLISEFVPLRLPNFHGTLSIWISGEMTTILISKIGI